ncbi:MAG: sulfatase-like hydrolase/transferase [Acidobacteriota bacterium]
MRLPLSLRVAIAVTALGCAPSDNAATASAPPSKPVSVVLLTLDTTRADALGCYGSTTALTPSLDSLAARGVRYARAFTGCPLTLVAHASLMTGRVPPEHGVRDNGTSVLPASVPTLAERLKGRGYATAAFVGSRVLDRRFGLDRGFDVYDDHMPAEQLGEYGYPERDAAAVTDAAIAWLSGQGSSGRFFLWVHYYDPHAPYTPPADLSGPTDAAKYAGEVAYMDRQVGRLFDAIPGGAESVLVAAVADHGEALGAHGERSHGVMLYGETMQVPLILAGSALPRGKVMAEVCASRLLAATILDVVGDADGSRAFGGPLPVPGRGASTFADTPAAVYGETEMPALAYGWSALQSLTEDRYKLVVAPRPELYDLQADPHEAKNLYAERPDEAARLEKALRTYEGTLKSVRAPVPAPDAELRKSLESLGYVGGGSTPGTIDPKDGLPMLDELQKAKELISADPKAAAAAFADLVKRSPGNLPFLTQLARAQSASGDGAAAVATFEKALSLNPKLDFLHLNMGDALRDMGRIEEARASYQRALDINPRFAAAWAHMAELADRAGRKDEVRATLGAAVSMGTDSAALLTWLAQLELSAGDGAAGEEHLKQAVTLSPRFLPAWVLVGERHEELGQLDAARGSFEQATVIDPQSGIAWLHLGKVLVKLQDARAIQALQRTIEVEPGSPRAAEASQILSALR